MPEEEETSLIGDESGKENDVKATEAETKDAKVDDAEAVDAKADDAEAKADEETKESEDDKDQDGAPDEYTDFSMPEGMDIDKAALAEFAPVAKELNLTQDQAQKLVDIQAKAVQDSVKAQSDAWAETKKTWEAEVKADKEIGGDNFDEKVASAKIALDKIGTPELRNLLNATGIGSNVELIRAFSKVGDMIKDDTMHFGGASNSGEKKSAAQILFPDLD